MSNPPSLPPVTLETIMSLRDACQATAAMQSSIKRMYKNVVCPVCHNILANPSTLSCGHTFCKECIVEYSGNHTQCPVKDCATLFSMKIGDSEFYRHNPHVETLVECVSSMVQTLAQAEPGWYRRGDDGNSNDAADDDATDDDAKDKGNSNENVQHVVDMSSLQQSVDAAVAMAPSSPTSKDGATFATAVSSLNQDTDSVGTDL